MDNKNHPLREVFSAYPEYPEDWIEYAFLRWCHPLGALAWTPAKEKALERHPDWVDWLERDCFKFLASEDGDWKAFLRAELKNFMNLAKEL